MATIREFAPAKINLTLGVAGRRDDGFHLLESLVAFADLGDVLTLDTVGNAGVQITGPMADGLAGPDILARTLALVEERAPELARGAVHLEKILPVAAGVGGGSADAGALLRALYRANGPLSEGVDWHGLARSLGADVPVCLEARSLWMTGVGEDLFEIENGLPVLQAVLVNPMVAVPADKTARVFRVLDAGPVREGYVPPVAPQFADREALLQFMRANANGLQRAAEEIVPEVGVVRDALAALPGIEYVGLSGAGPTSFGIFPNREAAEAARAELAAVHPGWWTIAVKLS
ncbi:4-(cytidine 5'-diphospho)-2-C-methyl-D-erythritol kinase [Hyphomicrobium sp. CS1GBMeth3]|uniref:4-(cytidine 5'-diphospho)-2-C-methyl-D-erythritol kinase n=1 Tax=Hyphomicrobium sp. CS1GBMeth3 TaxID=1892845 RepID=UPI00092FF4C1|nr:4-(cytidine 5'-diphospho)-2-C-methyl-D-erythritol kinase [Hyphomicrobium sp. CS1GBMeth3]